MKRPPRMLWLVTSPPGSPGERAAAAARRAAAREGWEVTVVRPWRSRGTASNPAELPDEFPGEILEQRPVELAFEHFAFRGELRRDVAEPGVERWWAVPRSPRLEAPLAAAFVAAAALEIARAERHAGIVLVGLAAAMVPILLNSRLRAHPQFEELRTYWVVDDLHNEGWIEGSVLAELGLPEALRQAPFGDGARVSALRSALHLADGLLVPPARGIRDSLRSVAEGSTAEALVARQNDLVPFPWALDRPAESTSEGMATVGKERVQAKEAAQRTLGLPVDARIPLVVSFEPSVAARRLIDEAVPAAERQRAQLALVERDSTLSAEQREIVLRGADVLISAAPWDAFGFDVARGLRCGVLPVFFASSGAAHAAGPVGFPFRAFLSSSLKRALGTALSSYRSTASWKKLRAEAAAAAAEDPWPRALKRWRASWKEALAKPTRRVALPSPPPIGGAAVRGLDPAGASPSSEPPHEVFIDWGPGLPERYQEDAIALLVQSPRSLYAYWDVASAAPAATAGYRLRLQEVDGRSGAAGAVGAEGVGSKQGVAVGEWGDYWIQAEPGRSYAVELTTEAGDVVLRSAEAQTPPEDRSSRAQVRWWEPAVASSGAPATVAEASASEIASSMTLALRPIAGESRVGPRGAVPPGIPPLSGVRDPGEPVDGLPTSREANSGPRLGGSSEWLPLPPGPTSS